MTTSFVFNAEPRGDLGKGASRRLRRADQVPAIVYGAGKEPEAITLNHLDVLKQLQNNAVYSHVLTLNIADRQESVLLRDLQRHPFKPRIQHMDFLRVRADRKLRAHVPLRFLNVETARGVKQQGGVVSHSLIDIEIACLPKDLPETIGIDLTNLGLGEAIHLSGLQLPEGVELATRVAPGSEMDAVVVSIHHPAGGEEKAAT